MSERIQEECGLFGVYSDTVCDVAQEVCIGLYALQHRGQESAGIVVNNDGNFRTHKNIGFVSEVCTQDAVKKLGVGKIAVGHVLSAYREKEDRISPQPLVMRYKKGNMCVAHNGAIVNAHQLRSELEVGGAIFQTLCDAELIAYIVASERINCNCVELAVANAINRLQGAYSVVIMTHGKLIAARDPHGFRPLCIGKRGNTYFVASESCALDALHAEFVRDVEPGEVVCINSEGINSIKTHCGGQGAFCAFEYVYFARPDSVINGQSVHMARQKAGEILAQRYPAKADMVCGVPNSGLDAAIGYAAASSIPYGVALIKNRFVGRFADQKKIGNSEYSESVRLNALTSAVKGKRIVLVDDSIVRGNTLARIVKTLKDAGALEVHVRVSSPMFMHPCYFGTSIRNRDELIARRMDKEGIRRHIGADSLGYLESDDLAKLVCDCNMGLCTACFTGEYPVEVPEVEPQSKYDRKLPI